MIRRSGEILRSSLRRRRREYLRLVGWSLVQAVPSFLSGWIVARAVDRGFLADRVSIGFVWLGVLACSFLVGAWATRHATLWLAALIEPFRDELVTRVTTGTLRRSTVRGQPADTAGVARLTEHVEIARDAYGGVVMFLQGFVVTVVSALLGLATLHPALLLLVLPPLLVGLGVFCAALRALAARQQAVIVADERISETASAVTGGLRDVVACGAEERVRSQVGSEVDAAARAERSLARLTAFRTAALGIGGWAPALLILAGAPWLVRNGVTAGAVLGALTYVSQGLQPALQGFAQTLSGSGLWLMVAIGRILETAEPPATEPATATGPSDRPRPTKAFQPELRPQLGDPADAHSRPAHPRGGRVELHGVTFGYARSAEPVIRGLDLALRHGEHLAVVGPSGAGKSTLAALIAGVLEPQAGQVRLDGVPVVALGDGDQLARHRVLIPQEAYLFAGTLQENLTYLAPGAAPAEVEAAVRAVGAAPLVERLGGYDAALDPRDLSAGERQLIALARALLPAPRLTLLDEATCHLDPVAEAAAEEAFADRPGTLIVVAHRISSALRADRILVMDGTRVALGTHEELLADSALYRDLVGHWGAAHPSVAPVGSMARSGLVRDAVRILLKLAAHLRTFTPSPTPGRSGWRRSDFVRPFSG